MADTTSVLPRLSPTRRRIAPTVQRERFNAPTKQCAGVSTHKRIDAPTHRRINVSTHQRVGAPARTQWHNQQSEAIAAFRIGLNSQPHPQSQSLTDLLLEPPQAQAPLELRRQSKLELAVRVRHSLHRASTRAMATTRISQLSHLRPLLGDLEEVTDLSTLEYSNPMGEGYDRYNAPPWTLPLHHGQFKAWRSPRVTAHMNELLSHEVAGIPGQTFMHIFEEMTASGCNVYVSVRMVTSKTSW